MNNKSCDSRFRYPQTRADYENERDRDTEASAVVQKFKSKQRRTMAWMLFATPFLFLSVVLTRGWLIVAVFGLVIAALVIDGVWNLFTISETNIINLDKDGNPRRDLYSAREIRRFNKDKVSAAILVAG